MNAKLFKIIVFAIILLYLYPFANTGLPETHDSQIHVARIAAYQKAFLNLNFPPRWAGNLNFGYGSPLFIFYAPFPGYLGATLSILGFSFENSFKILLIIAFILKSISFFIWLRPNYCRRISVIGSILYSVIPYHFLNIYVRGDIGELYGFVFIPLIFWSIDNIIIKQNIKFAYLGAIFFALLILSHSGLSLIFTPVFLLYFIIKIFDFQQIKYFTAMIVLGLLLSCFFWFPAIYEQKYTHSDMFNADMYQRHFTPTEKIIHSEWNFGSEINSPGGLSPEIGLIFFIFSIIAITNNIRRKNKKMLFWTIIFFSGIYMSTKYSLVLWQNIWLLKKLQFPWRFMGLASFASCVFAIHILSKIKNNKHSQLLLLVFILTGFLYTKTNGFFHNTDKFYKNFPFSTYYQGEATTVWSAGDPSDYPDSQVEIISGSGNISNYSKTNSVHVMNVVAENNLSILENTLYYPGWKAYVSNIQTPIQFQDPSHKGFITFNVPKGKHQIVVKFTETKIRTITNIISFLTWLTVVSFIYKYSITKK
ncbi:6-pyruvoyl-tetrahydropterin synthase-related protein [Patescibacteria group bacterium]